MFNLPKDHSIDVRKLEQLLEYDNLTTSYKLFWFSGIFNEIIRGNQRITFKRVVCRMIASAWYTILQYHLNFGVCDKLNDIVHLIHNRQNINSDINENDLLQILENINDSEMDKAISDFYKYVPYRLISPFFATELRGLKDAVKNKLILNMSQSTTTALYQLHVPENIIYINDNWFEYIYKNQNIVAGWLNFRLVYYLQKKNPNVPAIPFKLTAPRQRNLTLAKKFWSEVKRQTSVFDIYTDKELNEDNFASYGELSIDHFIPWSFVLHDELWNLVPTFKNVNSSKSNKLPELDLYIDKFCEVQFTAFDFVRKRKGLKGILEDYLTINRKLDLNDLININKTK